MSKIYHKPLDSARGKPIGALVSGGLDSAIMLWRLAQTNTRVVPVYIRCGLCWEKAELQATRKFLKKLAPWFRSAELQPLPRPPASRVPGLQSLAVLEFPMKDAYGNHWSVSGKGVPSYQSPDEACFLPARNLLLITKAAVYLSRRGIHQLALGNLMTNPFPDSSKKYFKELSWILSQSLQGPFRILSPLGREQKWQLIKKSTRLPLELTLSCAQPSGAILHCGRCNKCAERQHAFKKAGVPDPTRYASA